MRSRINGSDDELSSLSCLMVNRLGYYDWINTSTHAFEISFLPSLYGTYAGQELSLGLLETPYKNDPPYDTYLLSVNPYGEPGRDDYAAGKYRAYKWLVMGIDNKIYSELSTSKDSLMNNDDSSGWSVDVQLYQPILEGHYGSLSAEGGYDIDVLCSTFDWWPGEVSKRQYDAMWKNFILMAWGGRDLQTFPNPSMVFPPLYDPNLLNFNCFDTYSSTWLASEAQGKGLQLFNAFAAELRNRYGSDWTRACSMNIHHFGTSLFEYGQLNDGSSRYKTGIVSPLLGFIDFLYGTSYNTMSQLDDVVKDSVVESISARLLYPQFLSACAVTQLSSPYMGWGGAGVDEHCRLFSQNIDGYKTDSLGFYETNPKMSYANYVALCDFYRSFCTMEQNDLRHHVRFAVTDHKWQMDHVQVDRDYEHYALADAIGVTINEDEGYAEFDIQYGHSFHQVQDISTYNTFSNHIETTRRQCYNFLYEGEGLGFEREFQLNLSNYVVSDPVLGLIPNPGLDPEDKAWVERLFPPNPEQEREKDIQALTDEYQKSKKEREDQIAELSASLEPLYPQYESELYNAEIQLVTEVFPHFGYPIPQPVPHYPEDNDYWNDWFYPGVSAAIQNDQTLSTDELRNERQREMYQYTDDIISAHYSEGGEGWNIEMKWEATFNEIYDQINALEEQIKQLTQQYQKDREQLEQKIYHPQIPSQEDQLSILANGIGGIGPVIQTGNGHRECITVSRMRAVAPLSGLYGRVFDYAGDGNPISTNLNYWPAPIILLGPEKENILVREWLPYKTQSYSGAQPAPAFDEPELSDYAFAGFSGLNSGIGYKTSLTNDARDDDQFNILRSKCPRFWTSKSGDLDDWLGTVPEDIPWPQDHTEHQRVDFTNPVFQISVSEDLIGANPQKQKLVLFNGEQRSDLRVSIGESITMSMSDLLTGVHRLGTIPIGRASFDVQPRPRSTMVYWTTGPDYEYLIYDQCNYMLRSARFTLH